MCSFKRAPFYNLCQHSGRFRKKTVRDVTGCVGTATTPTSVLSDAVDVLENNDYMPILNGIVHHL